MYRWTATTEETGANSKFALCVSKIYNKKIIINYSDNSVKVRYRTANFSPTPEELSLIKQQSNELFERIYLVVTLVNYFEKEGLISLFRNQNRATTITLGDTSIPDGGILNEIEDDTIKNLLLEYTDKILIVTTAFNEFVKNNFVSKEELRQIRSNKIAWIGIILALLTSLTSSYFSFRAMDNKEVINFNSDFNNKIINPDSLYSKLNNISNSIKQLNEKTNNLDSTYKEIKKIRIQVKKINNTQK